MTSTTRRVVIGRLLVIAGFTVILAACGTGAPNSTAESAAPASSNSSAPTAISSSIDFTASLIDGSPITLSEQLAQRPVAMWFWAPG